MSASVIGCRCRKGTVALRGFARVASSLQGCACADTTENDPVMSTIRKLSFAPAGWIALSTATLFFVLSTQSRAELPSCDTKGPVGLALAWRDARATSVVVFPSEGSRFGRPTRPSNRDGGWVLGDGKDDIAAIWNNEGSVPLTTAQPLRCSSLHRRLPSPASRRPARRRRSAPPPAARAQFAGGAGTGTAMRRQRRFVCAAAGHWTVSFSGPAAGSVTAS